MLAPPKKDLAGTFLRMASSGRAKDAFEAFTAPGFRHHNPYFPGDADALARAMDEDAAGGPKKRITIVHAIEEGDLVALHVKVERGDEVIAVVHLYRFEGDKIAELWDIGQAAPQVMPNANGLF